MSSALSILLLQGDAEATLLADAALAIQTVLPEREIELVRVWSTRPDWLQQGIGTPPVLRERGLLEDCDVVAMLNRPHALVILPFLPVVATPAWSHRDGGAFLAHRSLCAAWSSEELRLMAECTALPALLPEAAARAFQALIMRLQDSGAAVALSMAFRHVSEPLQHQRLDGPPSLRELIRRSNLEVARLSQRTGCFVLDLDRPLAQAGGGPLRADCFGGADDAAELALEELAALVMDALPDAQALA